MAENKQSGTFFMAHRVVYSSIVLMVIDYCLLLVFHYDENMVLEL